MQERMRDVPMKPLHWYAWYAYFPNFYNGRHTYGDIWQEVVYTKNRKKILSHGRIFSQCVLHKIWYESETKKFCVPSVCNTYYKGSTCTLPAIRSNYQEGIG
jgi:hypothetical protein